MPPDASHANPVEPTAEHLRAGSGTSLDPPDTDPRFLAPEASSLTDRSAGLTAQQATATDCLTPSEVARLYRTDRRLLEARVAALEKAVEYRESQLETVVEQYETLLQERTQHDAENFDRESATVAFSEPTTIDRVCETLGRLQSALRSFL